MSNVIQDLKDWYPVRVIEDGGKYWIRWQYLGQQNFAQAFYTDSLRLAFTRYQKPAITTPIDILDTLDDNHPLLEPGGLIFHLSRCGSTLLARMLSALPGQVVLSEPPPIDDLLRSKLDVESRRHYLEKMFRLLQRQRRDNERCIFFKLDPWHTPAIGELRALLPDTRFMFLYRNPLEVLVSHRRQTGMHMVPGLIDPLWYGYLAGQASEFHPYEYAAWVLGCIMQKVLDQMDQGIVLLNYKELGENAWSRVPQIFNLKEDWVLAKAVRYRHAKNDAAFTDDRIDKLRQADKQMRQYCRCYTAKPYERLESTRLTARSNEAEIQVTDY